MTSIENKRFLEAVFADTAKDSGRSFIEALADDVRWTIIGSTAWSKAYVGKASVIVELRRPLSMQLAGSNTTRAHRFIAEGDFVVIQATGHNVTRSGMPYANSYCWVIRMAGEKMVEPTEYADIQLIAAALVDPSDQKERS
jgi:uncharacterized protein